MNNDREASMFAHKCMICGLAGLILLAFSTSSHAETASASTLAKGRALFNENCAVCHQEDAIGAPGVAPSLTNPELLSIASDKFFEGTIRDGRV
ncbi:MAG: c-type cytochrome, partial [Acidobacteriota bacterium]